MILPKAAAERMLNAADSKSQEAALIEAEVFLNAAPISLWPGSAGTGNLVASGPKASGGAGSSGGAGDLVAGSSPTPTISPRLLQGITIPGLTSKTPKEPGNEPAAVRDSSPQALKELQKSYQSVFDRMVQDLDGQANFISYAPPTFIAFHNGIYLQLSLTAILPPGAAGSQYRLAALAFDQHVSHLIRPVYAYFKDRGDFDGIDFSATVRLGAAEEAGKSPVAVEFLFPLADVRAYAAFDCTGQQLIDGSYVLINGERVGLDLQAAEAGVSAQ